MSEDVPDFTAHAVIGSLLVLDAAVLGYAPAGPWDSESFSVGILGLIGLGLWYFAWYRATFKRKLGALKIILKRNMQDYTKFVTEHV